MVDVTNLYFNDMEDYEKYGYLSICDYQPMIDAFGKVAVQVDDTDYSGDTRVLYDNDGKIGHLLFGWGSCCGCDALQACRTVAKVQELCDELENSIKWFDTKEEAIEWFENHDWEGNWTCNDKNTKKYISKVLEYLKGKDDE